MPSRGIRTHNLSRRATVDLRLRPRGYWDRQTKILGDKINLNWHFYGFGNLRYIGTNQLGKTGVIKKGKVIERWSKLSIAENFSHIYNSLRMEKKENLKM